MIKPYFVIGALALIWAFLILRTKFPAIQSEHEQDSGDHGHFRELLRYPHFLLAVVASVFSTLALKRGPGAISSLTFRNTPMSPKKSRAISLRERWEPSE